MGREHRLRDGRTRQRERDIQIDRQTDKQTARQLKRQTLTVTKQENEIFASLDALKAFEI